MAARSAPAFALRASICASSTRRGFAYYATLAAAFGLFTAFVAGWWPVALAALVAMAALGWLCRLWAVPGSVDAYHHRVARLFDALNDASHRVYSPAAQAARLEHELGRLVPPPRWQADHRLLLAIVGEAVTVPDDERSLRERERRLRAQGVAIAAIAGAINTGRAADDEAPYRDALNALLEQVGTYQQTRLAVLGAQLDGGLARISQLRVPRGAQAEHTALVAALRDYVAAAKALYAAWAGQPPGADEPALDALEGAQARLETAVATYAA